MSLDNLPVEWLSLQLKDIGNIYTGKTPSSKDVDNFDGDIPFVKPGDLDKGGYIFNTSTHISSPALASLPNLPANSIMVTCIGNMGKVGITTEVSATNQQINSIVPFKEFINYKYIYYYCLTLKNWLDRESSATTIAIVNKGRFSEAPIPLPPLAEQQEIVRQLDVMLAQVEQIKARLDAIPAILKKFRQSVLGDAVSGKLTEEWRSKNNYSKLDYAQSLIIERAEKGIKANKLSISEIVLNEPFNIPISWKWVRLGNVVLKITDGAHNTPKLLEKGFPYVTAKDIKDGIIDFSNQKYISKKDHDELYFKCKPEVGDLLVVNIGAGTGNNAIVNVNFEFSFKNVAIIKKSKFLSSEYLQIFFESQKKRLFSEKAKGGAQPFLSLTDFHDLAFALPPFEEQVEIANNVRNLFIYANRIEEAIQSAQKRVNLLTQSILAKAFSGELTAEWRQQHQELISGVNSAESLLAKIQAEREASKPVKKAKKVK